MRRLKRFALDATYLCATAGIGFTLPFLPLYLTQQGLSDRSIGWISTCAAMSGLAQFPIAYWSDRVGTRKPFLIAAAVLLALATFLLPQSQNPVIIGALVILFAENGICRAVVESLTGAEVTTIAVDNQRGAALGRLRMIKPMGIIVVALLGSWWAQIHGVSSILGPLVIVQALGLIAALMIPATIAHSTSAIQIKPSKSKLVTSAPPRRAH